MRAQDFAEKSANLFLYGLPIAIFGMPVLAFIFVNFADGALTFVSPVLYGIAFIGYMGIPVIGFLGACVGVWCYLKKDYEYKVLKQILVLTVLVIYISVSIIATQAYKSMRHETSLKISPAKVQQQ